MADRTVADKPDPNFASTGPRPKAYRCRLLGPTKRREVESRRGAVAWAIRHRSVSPPRSSNRTCGFPASGSPTGFAARHTADGQFKQVSRDDTVARQQPSPCGKAPSEAFGCFLVLLGSSPITDPQPLRKRARSQGPFLRRHYPASQVVRPCPTPARPAVLVTALELRPPAGTDLPRLPGPPFQRAVPITPVDRNGCMCRLLPHSTRPSPADRRVGIHDFTFEACSGFTRVTARWIARPPKATFVTRLQDGQLPDRPARQLPDQPTTLWVVPSSTGVSRRRGALSVPG